MKDQLSDIVIEVDQIVNDIEDLRIAIKMLHLRLLKLKKERVDELTETIRVAEIIREVEGQF